MGNDQKTNGLAALERRLWAAADRLCANLPLRPFHAATDRFDFILARGSN
jgi:hypothetical protein